MTACILCLKEVTLEDAHDIDEEITENYRISTAIRDNFELHELILSENSSHDLCSDCLATLKAFRLLQLQVHDSYLSLQQAFEATDVIEIEVTDETAAAFADPNEDELISEEYLDEEVADSFEVVERPRRRRHPANDVEGEQKIRDLIDIKCHHCDIDFDTFQDVCKHFKKSHAQERAFLVCCGKRFTQRSLLLEHLEYHDKSRVHRCDACSKEFKTAAILRSHARNFHASERPAQPTCAECGKTFANKYVLKTHMRRHLVDEERTFECYICRRPAKNVQLLRHHFKYKHEGARTSVCHICSKIVTRLDIHVRQVHAQEPVERVRCDICGHWLKATTLRGHLATHSESGFSCEICGKFLKNRNSYFCHMKRVHTEGRFKCSVCAKGFHSEGRLQEHVACQHTGHYLHKCRVESCEKMFRNAGRRRTHERRMHPLEYERHFKPIYLRDHVESSAS